ncbi:MAG: protein kinase [Gammaproteobacteria bacterium]|nr:protein kinase [Gammaproteobacteria bacterium]
MEPLAKGRRISDRYTLLALLHTSAHCQVWLARDDQLKSRVAIKIANSDDVTGVNLLKNEFAQCGRCVHSGIVRAFECHADDNFTYLTLEYLSGGSLEKLAGRPHAQFLPALIQIAEALDHVHQQGIVHRDIKLSNFLFDERKHTRLIDFGIASESGAAGLRSGGSSRSMSPAQRDGEPPEPGDDMYAFGVALYRLAEGRWPDEEGPPLNLGATLSELVEQLMHPDAQQRPARMAIVADALRQALDEQGNVTVPPDEFVFDTAEDDRIEVIDPGNNSTASHGAAAPPPTRHKRLVPLLLLYGFIGLVALFYVVPRWVGEREPVTASADAPTSAVTPAPVATQSPPRATDIEPWKLAQQAKMRKDAESMLEQLLDKQFYLDDKKAIVWAPERFDQIKQAAIAGDQLFRQKKYEQALAKYSEGHDIAADLSDIADTIVTDTLAEADAAIAAGDAALADQKYSTVLQIDATSERAQTGLERAANLDEVLALVDRAEELEQSGDYDAALTAYQQAGELDAQWQAATDGINRIQRQRARRAFSGHMSAGFAALEKSDFDRARRAFERARSLRPGASEVTEALQQLDTAVRLQDVNRLEGEARVLEGRGDWRAAERQYKAALEQDPTLQSARDGVRRVRNRADVEEELQTLLGEPMRLTSASAYNSAQALLTRLQPYAGDARLDAQAAELRNLMALTRQPVTVTLNSDGATDVTVYRVGKMGTFNSRTLELRPGEYTAVGTRAGFRDVRVTIALAPGETDVRYEIMCRERI